jgi:hypothetical protein
MVQRAKAWTLLIATKPFNFRVLIADDEPGILETAALILGERGWRDVPGPQTPVRIAIPGVNYRLGICRHGAGFVVVRLTPRGIPYRICVPFGAAQSLLFLDRHRREARLPTLREYLPPSLCPPAFQSHSR